MVVRRGQHQKNVNRWWSKRDNFKKLSIDGGQKGPTSKNVKPCWDLHRHRPQQLCLHHHHHLRDASGPLAEQSWSSEKMEVIMSPINLEKIDCSKQYYNWKHARLIQCIFSLWISKYDLSYKYRTCIMWIEPWGFCEVFPGFYCPGTPRIVYVKLMATFSTRG